MFNSLAFLVFFPIVVAIYFILPYRYRWALLLAASYYFYAAFALEYVVWLAVSTLISYVLAILIARTPAPARRKALLALSLLSNLGLLFVLKYLTFFNDSLRTLFNQFNILYNVPAFQALLPVGISFYTFQVLSYTIDVYRGKIEPERHLGIFALFVSFFPRLVAGPIERGGHLIPQFHVNHEFSASRVSSGLRRILWGMFKKVVIADRLAMYVDAVYNHPTDHQGLPVVLATYFFAIQLYCDFSGYSDIAVGAARVMGYDLVENFKQPYSSSSIADFWRRWHISLSNWFRDYLYIPLGGNRVPEWHRYANVLIVFVASGLWHGANWTFVLWGALHGLYYLLEDWTRKIRVQIAQALHLADGFRAMQGIASQEKPTVRTAIGVFVTFHLVCFAWIFFRANSISDAFLLINRMVQIRNSTDVYAPWVGIVDHPGLEMAFAFGLVVLLAAAHSAGRRKEYEVGSRWVRWAAYLLLALAILNLGIGKETPFLYSQF